MRLGRLQIQALKGGLGNFTSFGIEAILPRLYALGLVESGNNIMGDHVYRLTPAGLRALADALEKRP